MSDMASLETLQARGLKASQTLTTIPDAAWDITRGSLPPWQDTFDELYALNQSLVDAVAKANHVLALPSNISGLTYKMSELESRIATVGANVNVRVNLPSKDLNYVPALVDVGGVYLETGQRALEDYATNPIAGVKAFFAGDKKYGSEGVAGANGDLSLKGYGVIIAAVVAFAAIIALVIGIRFR
jgi:hypothetical protein